MTIRDAIVEFAGGQAPWVQDALRRLTLKEELDATDKAELIRMIKTENGLLVETPAPTPEALSTAHLRPIADGQQPVILRELSGVKHTNRLAEGQSLRFAVDGITLIYGDNGSGKSGYCRVLKKLCRVREGAQESILPDAFGHPPGAPAEAIVRFSVGDDEETVTWTDGAEPPPDLRCITVFDSKAVPLYVDKDGKIEFLPFGFDLLPRLGSLYGDLFRGFAGEIESAEAKCDSALPEMPTDTDVAILVEKLGCQTALEAFPREDEIRSLGQWAEQHAGRLAELNQTLIGDSATLTAALERAEATAHSLRSTLAPLMLSLDDDAIEAIRAKVRKARHARKTASLAAGELFRGEPLAGVGSDPWRKMFEYACEYSAIAYPEQEFPVTGGEKHCVLCQQALSAEAGQRLIRFAAYVRGAAETEAQRLEADVAAANKALKELEIGDPRQATFPLGGFDGADEGLVTDAEAFLQALTGRLSAALGFISGKSEFVDPVPLPADPSTRLLEAADRFKKRVTTLRTAQTDGELRSRLEAERAQLEGRLLLSNNLGAFLVRRADLERLCRLRQCKTSCSTTGLSMKITQLRREFITGDFKERLDAEWAYFGIEYLPLKVTDRSDHGASYVGIGLETLRRVKTQDILSEGERKALALASFFAEIGGIPDSSGLIFDDPVSSLDHLHRRTVADRIIREAQDGRQVVVLTHDLVFFYELRDAAAAVTPQVPVVTHEVFHSVEHGFGTVRENQEPWFALPVGQRVPRLQQRLAALKGIADRSGDEYRKALVAFYADLRETWERLVEGELLRGVVSRFGTEVKTLSLREVVVEDDDHKRVYWGMKRASEWSGHDRAPARQNSPPDPQTAAQDLAELESLLAVIKKRRKAIRSQREALERPPKGNLA